MIEGLPVAGGPGAGVGGPSQWARRRRSWASSWATTRSRSTWASDAERDLFWVYDDLHMPAPAEPDVLRHRRLVAHLRPHVPPVRHAVRRRLAGQERQRLPLHGGDPGRPRTCGSTARSTAPATARGCRATPRTPATMGAYLDTVLPVYGAHFADWWRDRLVPEMQRNFAYLEGQLDRADGMSAGRARRACSRTRSTSTTGTGRSTGCSTSPSCRRRSTCARSWSGSAARVDEELLGRLQNSPSDRNWDSIEALWRDEGRGPRRPGAARGRSRGDGAEIAGRAARRPSAAGGSSPSGSSPTSASSAGTPSGATSSSSRPCASRWSRSSSSSAATSRATTTTRRRSRRCGATSRRPRRRSSTGLDGRRARRDARGQRDQPADGAAHARTTTSTSTRAPTPTSAWC